MVAVKEMCCVAGDEDCETVPVNTSWKRKTYVTKREEIKTKMTSGGKHVNHKGWKIMP